MTNKTAERWLARIRNLKTPWTENEIKYFRKQMGLCSTLHIVDKTVLKAKFQAITEEYEYSITKEQSEKGYQYLYNLVFRKDGKIRQSKENPLQHDVNCINILRNFSYFKFVGIINQYNDTYGERNFYEPIFRVYSKSGEYFDYTGVHKSMIRVF